MTEQQAKFAKLFLETRLPEELMAGITGNVPIEIKELPVKWLGVFRRKGKGFSGNIAKRLQVKDVSILPSVDDPEKLEGIVTCEIDVTPDMCNAQGLLDQGCIVYLLDECSTISMVVGNAAEGRMAPAGVSQTINTLFHSAATVGTTLRIINRALASGFETNSAKTEIWNKQTHRLVASGTQLSMSPSIPPKWAADKAT
ncbi:hypothetical protein CVT24_010809 [Panaeolus cyanescens]|uniref:Uncharacterized protein n=1 Tax=Panaeolus cyanescens TaxID=181874 RepID=A0A409VGW8_9AGAR|nr:hypothetical protein CVT24_010809 [Panaeolus cyanescens]